MTYLEQVARPKVDRSHGPSEVWARPAIKKAIERFRKKLGLRLRTIRERNGMTQEQAAERAGIHAKQLGVIEGGKTNVSFPSLVGLAYAYGVSLADFFEGMPVVR